MENFLKGGIKMIGIGFISNLSTNFQYDLWREGENFYKHKLGNEPEIISDPESIIIIKQTFDNKIHYQRITLPNNHDFILFEKTIISPKK